MKAGILTFHYSYNHGAVLQCLALHRVLKQLGCDPDVIRYIPPLFAKLEGSLLHGWGLRQGQLVANLPGKIIQARFGWRLRRVFDRFRAEHLTLTRLCSTPDDIAEVVRDHDVVIAGSDQVWHFAQSPPFFLEWGKPFPGRKISYAACCGTTQQPSEDRTQIGRWIAGFDAISVRNEFSRRLVREVSGRTAEVVADPTLLTGLNDLARRPVGFGEDPYILMYVLGDEIAGGHSKVLAAIRDRIGPHPVVAVVSSVHKPQRSPWADRVLYTAGPAEWLHLVAHARFVYTDSYHGALLSVKAEKPFCVYYREPSRAPRLLDLAERYHLQDFVAENADRAVECIRRNQYDFSRVHQAIRQHAEQSRAYLRTAIFGGAHS